MSSGSRRNSSNPNVPSGREKMSTQRSTAGVDGLDSTFHVGSRRADMRSTVRQVVVASSSIYAHPMASALIGRRAELAWLRARVDLALGGFPHLVLVEGESG